MSATAQTDLGMDQVAGIVYSMIDAYNVTVDGDEPRDRWFLLDERDQAQTIMAVTAMRDAPEISPEENHANWCVVMEEKGWTPGEELDYERQIHPNLVPFDQLPAKAQRMNYAIHALTMILSRPIEEVVG